jgi:hypothetical protein
MLRYYSRQRRFDDKIFLVALLMQHSSVLIFAIIHIIFVFWTFDVTMVHGSLCRMRWYAYHEKYLRTVVWFRKLLFCFPLYIFIFILIIKYTRVPWFGSSVRMFCKKAHHNFLNQLAVQIFSHPSLACPNGDRRRPSRPCDRPGATGSQSPPPKKKPWENIESLNLDSPWRCSRFVDSLASCSIRMRQWAAEMAVMA